MYSGLEESWFVTGLSASKTFVNKAVEILQSDVTEILPVVHAVTGCDSISPITSKKSLLWV